MLTAVYLTMLQHTVVLLLAKGTFRDSFSVGVAIRDELTANKPQCLHHQTAMFNIISYEKPQVNTQTVAIPSYISAQLLGSFRQCHLQTSAGRQSVRHITSTTKTYVYFS